jgi:hypothetical protein
MLPVRVGVPPGAGQRLCDLAWAVLQGLPDMGDPVHLRALASALGPGGDRPRVAGWLAGRGLSQGGLGGRMFASLRGRATVEEKTSDRPTFVSVLMLHECHACA